MDEGDGGVDRGRDVAVLGVEEGATDDESGGRGTAQGAVPLRVDPLPVHRHRIVDPSADAPLPKPLPNHIAATAGRSGKALRHSSATDRRWASLTLSVSAMSPISMMTSGRRA